MNEEYIGLSTNKQENLVETKKDMLRLYSLSTWYLNR